MNFFRKLFSRKKKVLEQAEQGMVGHPIIVNPKRASIKRNRERIKRLELAINKLVAGGVVSGERLDSLTLELEKRKLIKQANDLGGGS